MGVNLAEYGIDKNNTFVIEFRGMCSTPCESLKKHFPSGVVIGRHIFFPSESMRDEAMEYTQNHESEILPSGIVHADLIYHPVWADYECESDVMVIYTTD